MPDQQSADNSPTQVLAAERLSESIERIAIYADLAKGHFAAQDLEGCAYCVRTLMAHLMFVISTLDEIAKRKPAKPAGKDLAGS
jgi:hypothetical protein